MTSPLRYLALLGAFFLLTFTLVACGGGSVPGNAVVSIGGDAIKKTEFDHWMGVAAKTTAQQSGQTGAASAVPDAPDFTQCIAAKKKTAVKPAKGQPTPTDATYKSQCQTTYNGLRDQVMSFLISSAWIQGESADQGVKDPDAKVYKDFLTQKKQSFPQDSAYAAFLKSSGYVQEDLLYQIKIRSLSTDLRTKVLKGTDKVSAAAILAYYNKNQASFAQPEKRDLKIVLTKTIAKAKTALAALKGGQSFASVAKKYSTDAASKANGGILAGVPKGQQEKALDAATFTAPLNKLQGPVKTTFGYYDFIVTKITPATQQTLAQATPQIKQLLVSQNQQKVLDAFVKTFQAKWKARTDCRKGYVVDTCKNAPKTTTTAAGTATTAGAQTNAAPATGATTN